MNISNRRSAIGPPWLTHRRLRAHAVRTRPLAGALVAAVLLAGCGGSSPASSVAHDNSTIAKASTKSSTTSREATRPRTEASPLAFAKCMRAHGVPNYPDPSSPPPLPTTPTPQPAPSSGSNGINPLSPAYQSASNACKSLASAKPVSQTAQNQVMAAQLKFAVCMRANGVPNFPDPVPGRGFSYPSTTDPQSPALQGAYKNCRNFFPRPPG